MKIKIVKAFSSKSSNKTYNKEDVIETTVPVFLELSRKGFVIPLQATEEEKRQIQQEMDKAFAEHFEHLSKLPIPISKIKQQYPEQYQHLKEKEQELDKAFQELDYGRFLSLLNEIEEGLRELANRSPSYDEVKQQKQSPVSLNRKCVNCKSDAWIVLKSNSRQSAIQCSKCNHVELHIFKSKSDFFKSGETINLKQEQFILPEWLDSPESNPMNYKFDTDKQEWIYVPDWFKKGGKA